MSGQPQALTSNQCTLMESLCFKLAFAASARFNPGAMEKILAHRTNAGGKRASEKGRCASHSGNGVQLKETVDAVSRALADLPASDNATGAVERMLHANAILRHLPWPKPFDETTHRIRCGDARDLSWIASESVHLVVTSPPYWT